MRRVLQILAVASLLTVASPLHSREAGDVQGLVYSAANQPVVAAQVKLEAVLPEGSRFAGAVESFAGRQPSVPPLDIAITNEKGQFAFSNVPPGRYRVMTVQQGIPRDQGVAFSIAADATISDLLVRLVEGASIRGRILNTRGATLPDMQATLVRVQNNSIGQLTQNIVATARSDDRGEYRFYDVPPGPYYIGVSPPQRSAWSKAEEGPDRNQLLRRDVPTTSYGTSYYPGGVPLSKASPIVVRGGGQYDSIDFTIPLQSVHNLRGRVINSSGERFPQGCQILIAVTSRSMPALGETYTAVAAQDGTFEVRDVLPGEYWVMGRAPLLAASREKASVSPLPFAKAAVEIVSSDVTDVLLEFLPFVQVHGRVSLEGISVPPLYETMRFSLMPPTIGSCTYNAMPGLHGPLGSDGTFIYKALTPGEYTFEIGSLPSKFYVKRILYNGTELSEAKIRISGDTSQAISLVMGYSNARVTGSVSNQRGEPSQYQDVVLIPDGQQGRLDLYRTVSTNGTGHFTINGVAPGRYKLFSWEGSEPYFYLKTSALREFDALGAAIDVNESASLATKLTTIPYLAVQPEK